MKITNYKNYGRLWRVYGRSVLRYATPKKILNAVKTDLAYRRRIADVKSAPYILFLEPLYYCNLDCPLCDRQVFPEARTQRGQAGKLSLERFERILDEVGDYLFQVQIFGQGEPLLDWPRTQAIIQKSHARRIFTLMSTNCTLVTEQIADQVASSGLDYLVCAIDGVSQQSYEAYRVGGQVADAMAGVKLFLEAKRKHRANFTIEWQFLVNKYNDHELAEAKKIAADLGVFLRFSPIRGMEFSPDLQNQWLSTHPQFAVANHQNGQVVRDFPCYFLWRSIVLNSNEKIARCLIYQNVSEYADLKEMSVLEAFNHPSAQSARMLFSKYKKIPDENFPAPCNNCSYFHRHHGGPNLDKFESLGLPPRQTTSFVPAASLNRQSRTILPED